MRKRKEEGKGKAIDNFGCATT